MNKNKLFLVGLLIIFSLSLFAVQTRIDSLENILNTSTELEKLPILVQLIESYKMISPRKILQSAELGLSIAKKHELQSEIATFTSLAGDYYFAFSDYDVALDHFYESLRIFEAIGEEKNAARIMHTIADVMAKIDKFDESIQYYERSYAIMEKLDERVIMARISENIATTYATKNRDFKIALGYYLQALELFREFDIDIDIFYTLVNIGHTYNMMGMFTKALPYLEEAYLIIQKIGDRRLTASVLRNIAMSYRGKREFKKSISYFERSNEICGNDFPSTRLNSYKQLSDIYLEIKDYKKTYDYIMLAVALKDSIMSVESIERMNEIQTKYETEKKEQQIEILEKDNQIKNMTRNYLIMGFILILIIAIILYNRYRIKTKANINLSNANKTISDQNEQLQLISRILRHDIANNLYAVDRCLTNYFDSRKDEYLMDIPAQVNKSTDLIERFSKISYLINETNYVFPLSINEILERLIPSYENIEIELFGQGEALADDLLESVLDNIISNAIKHGKTDRVKIDIENEDEWVSVSIADYGKGIPEVFREKIFEESFVYGDTGNTGLGLFIVKKAVENYGGTVTVMGNNPQGTVFIIKLKKA